MAWSLERIRQMADRVAASYGLDVVEVESMGGGKQRTLRVFVEKNAGERARLAAEAGAEVSGAAHEAMPSGVPPEQLAWVTHEDCEQFSRDFGTLLDVEDLVPGGEYTLEVSSPGLDRKLARPADFERFRGCLVKVDTFRTLAGNRHWHGRLTEVKAGGIVLDLTAGKRKGGKRRPAVKAAEKSAQAPETAEIAFENIERAQLVPEL